MSERREGKDRRAGVGRREEDVEIRRKLAEMEAIVLSQVKTINRQVRTLAKANLKTATGLQTHVAGCEKGQLEAKAALEENTRLTRDHGTELSVLKSKVMTLADYVEPRLEMEKNRALFWKMIAALFLAGRTPWSVKALVALGVAGVAYLYGGADALHKLLAWIFQQDH